MRALLAAALLIGMAGLVRADIHDPPSNAHGPTRKLGRGISNLVFGIAELPHEISRVNKRRVTPRLLVSVWCEESAAPSCAWAPGWVRS